MRDFELTLSCFDFCVHIFHRAKPNSSPDSYSGFIVQGCDATGVDRNTSDGYTIIALFKSMAKIKKLARLSSLFL
jgi:hypothetical protein